MAAEELRIRDHALVGVIPFYGTTARKLFDIERRAMDRPGLVIRRLNELLPIGRVLDIGAGDGFTAEALTNGSRTVVAMEPSPGMWAQSREVVWVGGEAEHLPFKDSTFPAAYATWAYFFSRNWDPRPGIDEARRVVREGGPMVFADNLGQDEFTSYSESDISADVSFWETHGFRVEVLETYFDFDDQNQADELMTLYFGPRVEPYPTRMSYRVGLFIGQA